MTGARRWLAVVALALAFLGAGATPGAALRQPGSDASDAQVTAIAAALRCPVCRDLSVADSPSPVAQEMRASIARDLAAGKSPDEIRAQFIAAYGEWILLAPPAQGITALAWIIPPLVLVAGLAAAGTAIVWRTGSFGSAGLSDRLKAGGLRRQAGRARVGGESTLTLEDRRLLEDELSKLDLE